MLICAVLCPIECHSFACPVFGVAQSFAVVRVCLVGVIDEQKRAEQVEKETANEAK